MRQHPAKTLALAVCGCTALWTVQAAAQGSNSQPTPQQLQQQIQQLQQQVQQLKSQRGGQSQGQGGTQGGQSQTVQASSQQGEQGQTTQTSTAGTSQSPQKNQGPTKKLSIGGGVAAEYQLKNNNAATNQRDGGNLIFDYFSLNVSGQYGNLSYGAEERFSTVNFADPSFLHYGWAAYDFDDHNQIKGGYFQVPFGNLPLGYQTFWGTLPYFAGFTDNQAAGIGYKYENGGWRFDLDAFKNDDLEQTSLYGSNPFQGYNQINGGNARIGYTFNQDGDNTLNVSVAARGGQLEVGERGTLESIDSNGNTTQVQQDQRNGSRWAATVAADANLGLWTIQGQAVTYEYNIPDNTQYNGSELSTQSITVENYGFAYKVPASGQIYAFNIARDFPVDLGPISKFQVYNNYSYLHSGEGDYNEFGDRIGDVQFDALGAEMVAGPVYVWADVLVGKNAAMTFIGPNNGNWHPRFNLTAAFYFNGDFVK